MLWRGIAIGVMISAPMGPVGILCIQRTLNKGRRTGFFTGVGAALSDLFYCLLTGFGLSFIQEFLERNQNVIQLVGSVLLIAFGIYLFRKNPSRELKSPDKVEKGSVKRDILGGFLFTFSNPLILFLIIGLFARFNFLMPEIKFYHYIAGFLAIFAGAIGWWWVVTFFVNKVSNHFNLRSMWLINRIIAVIIFIFAIVGIVTAVMALTAGKATAQTCVVRLAEGKIKAGAEGRCINYAAAVGNDDFSWCVNADNLSVRTSPLNRNRNAGWGVAAMSGDSFYVEALLSPVELSVKYMADSGSCGMEVCVRGVAPGGKVFADTLMLAAGQLASHRNNYSLRLSRTGGRWTLEGGATEMESIWTASDTGQMPVDSVAIVLPPRGALQVNRGTLHVWSTPSAVTRTEWVGDMEGLRDMVVRAADGLSGFYASSGSELDERLLRMGGEYTLAFVGTSPGCYDIIYVDGAEKGKGRWLPGMKKGEIHATAAEPGIYSLLWYDADMCPMDKDLTLTVLDSDNLLLSFPYQQSSFRLHRISY